MTIKFRLTLFIFSTILFTELSAQNVYFTGVGRALVTSDRLVDNTNKASKLKASGGYTLFDLGIYAKPNEVLRGGVILRAKNPFGGFYNDGNSLLIRQIQMEGLIAKKVKYEIGDIYLSHTKYTLWADDNADNKFEADVFAMRRNIVNYENFYVGNAWRMQGINAKTRLNFSKGLESLGIRVYGGRTMPTNFTTIPDRYFYGTRLDLVHSKYFRIAGNVAGVTDIAGTVKAADVEYKNVVYTSDLGFTLDNSEKLKFELDAELGASNFQLNRAIDTTEHKFNDFFYDGGVKATYKPLNVTLGVAYREVGFNFNSPMAQTRRMASPTSIALTTFPTMNDGLSNRQITTYDMYSQESKLYNQSIATTLMNYYVQYTMAEPYGRATPNRKGFTFTLNAGDDDKVLKANVELNLLSEVVSEGDSITQQKRNFTLLRSGLVFNLHKLLKFEKAIILNAGYRTESSKRDGTNPVNLSSSLIDLGLDVEVLKSLHLLGGLKMFNVKGSEVQTGRDNLNQIVTFGPGLTFDQQQNVIAAGMRYNYDANAYFSMHYHMVTYNDKQTELNNYDFNQMFFVFGLKF
jgi:hypothetical protein